MTLNRRQILAGAGLTVGLSPFMSSLLGQIQARAEGKSKHPLRFVFCIKSNGLWAEMIQPQGLEKLLPFKLDYDGRGRLVNGNHGNIRKKQTPAANLQLKEEHQLSEVMKPLEPFCDRISILQGFNSGFSVYHSGQYQTLGAFQGRNRNSRETLGATVDSLLARSGNSPIPHVCLGHDPKSPSGVAYVPTSAEGVGKPIPFYTKPKRAYKELFGVIDEGEAKKSYDTQSDILDFFAEDAKRLQKQVVGAERDQLNRYLSAFESIRKSRRAIEAISDKLRKHAPKSPGEIDAHATMKVGAGNTDIAIASLLSGLTHTVTLRFDLLGSTTYQGTGSLHAGVGHGQVKNILAARKKICGFHFQQIARLVSALKSIPEGEGTMLDNTVIVYTSDNGETHHSAGVNYPIVMIGDLGGRVAKRRYLSPGNAEKIDRSKPGYTRLGDLWATLLEAAGRKSKGFGIPLNGAPHKPIQTLLL